MRFREMFSLFLGCSKRLVKEVLDEIPIQNSRTAVGFPIGMISILKCLTVYFNICITL